MGDGTSISWTDATWNPVRGCSRVSEGCRNCYAERVAARFSKPGQPFHGFAQVVAPRDLLDQVGGRRNGWTRKVALVPEHLADPIRWKRPRRIFVNSMSDLFHESLTNEQIASVFGVMAAAPQHTFQVLTKRARRLREWFAWVVERGDGQALRRCGDAAQEAGARVYDRTEPAYVGGGVNQARSPWNNSLCRWPLSNAWLGVSVENQAAADERIPLLLATPAAVRFLSCEPLLGPVDLTIRYQAGTGVAHNMDALRGYGGWSTPRSQHALSWVIAGCESGHGARPCDVAWLRSLRDQCSAASVPFFLKQAVKLRGGDDESGDVHQIEAGAGSKRKARDVIELPYLDGVQYAAFPKATP